MWKHIEINQNLLKAETAKSTLIKMPHSSEYDGYVFWHPSKLVRDGRGGSTVSISYTGEFIFRLKKYGNGKYNSHEIISEKEIGAQEFEEVFARISPCGYEPEEPEIYTPTALLPENATADESLIDNE